MLDTEPNLISMYTNVSDLQNFTNLDYHTSLTDCHNESSGTNTNFTRYVDPQWGERRETNSVIFLALVVLR